MRYWKDVAVKSECVRYPTYRYLNKELLNRVSNTYQLLSTKEQGYIKMVKLMLDTILLMSNDVVTAL